MQRRPTGSACLHTKQHLLRGDVAARARGQLLERAQAVAVGAVHRDQLGVQHQLARASCARARRHNTGPPASASPCLRPASPCLRPVAALCPRAHARSPGPLAAPARAHGSAAFRTCCSRGDRPRSRQPSQVSAAVLTGSSSAQREQQRPAQQRPSQMAPAGCARSNLEWGHGAWGPRRAPAAAARTASPTSG